MSNWIIGEVGVVSLSATTPAGVPIDPASVAIKLKTPAGTIKTYTYGVDTELVKDSTGKYHIHIEFDAIGKWFWRWEVGTPDGTAESSVTVRRSSVLP